MYQEQSAQVHTFSDPTNNGRRLKIALINRPPQRLWAMLALLALRPCVGVDPVAFGSIDWSNRSNRSSNRPGPSESVISANAAPRRPPPLMTDAFIQSYPNHPIHHTQARAPSSILHEARPPAEALATAGSRRPACNVDAGGRQPGACRLDQPPRPCLCRAGQSRPSIGFEMVLLYNP